MSEIDREAEKERLRKELEAEEEERRSTQHMSELLLKGATMTNAHCDTCGDPIFRYEGQEFCPTCQEPVGEDGATQAQPEPGTDQQATDDTAATDTEHAPEPSGGAGQPEASTAEQPQQAAQSASSGATGAAPAIGSGGDLGDARASLVRTLTALAQRAEATDDAGQARRLLAAAREAAETLAALDQLGR